MKKPDVALLVHSCDRYEFLFPGFEFFFSKYWNFDIPFRYYFATEEKKVQIEGFENIFSGKGEWTERLRILLTKIPEKYVLYFQEDMWLSEAVNPDFFSGIIDLVTPLDFQQLKLHSSEVYTTTATPYYVEGFNIALLNNEKSDFLMSHQVTLWNKEFLLQQLQQSEHPWRNERKGTKRLRKLNAPIYHADYFAENGKPAINHNQNPVGRSCYYTVSINGTLHSNVVKYIPELMDGNVTAQQYAHELGLHFENQLTHDGQSRPRKVDVFKQLKNWIRSVVSG
jgi:hypothetical protein